MMGTAPSVLVFSLRHGEWIKPRLSKPPLARGIGAVRPISVAKAPPVSEFLGDIKK